jgi:type IV pilus assembly protein PilB
MLSIKNSLENAQANANVLFGELLVAKEILTRKQLVKALNEQRKTGGRLGEVLLRLKILKGDEITQALAEHLCLEYVHLDDFTRLDKNVTRLLPESIAKRFCLVVIGEEDDKIVVAMADPLNVVAIDTITLKINRQIKVVISSFEEIKRTIDSVYHGTDVTEQELRDLVELEITTGESKDDLQDDGVNGDVGIESDAETAPVIRFVDLLLKQAVKSRASDIHIEPQEILSEMDIAERRLPQDGRFRIKATNRNIDVRVSTIPTIYGEKVVMRILDSTATSHDIETLGFEPELLKDFRASLSQPHGIIIVTGPTGSGKSTTLYSALTYLKDVTKNITTVEDPVEYRLAGVNQIQIKPEIDLNFAKCLRSILRQDPDIILIGEIRDKETVEIAIKASLTGHLVLSTFHTNDAPSAISRLVYMGVEPYLLGSALNLVIAQRLVRKVCEKCKEPVTLNKEVLKRLGVDLESTKKAVFYHAKGCNSCGGTGYYGRLPIFEFLVMDNQIRHLLVEGADETQIRAAARKKGYGGLLQSGVTNMLKGLTTAEEVLSATFTEDVRN